MRRAAAALVLALLVVACGDDLGGSGPEANSVPELQALLADAGYRCEVEPPSINSCTIPANGHAELYGAAHLEERLAFLDACGDGEHVVGPTHVVIGRGWLVNARGPGVADDLADRTGGNAHSFCEEAVDADARAWVQANYPYLIFYAFWLAFLAGVAWLVRDRRRTRRGAGAPVA
jgi:hypothetical protein